MRREQTYTRPDGREITFRLTPQGVYLVELDEHVYRAKNRAHAWSWITAFMNDRDPFARGVRARQDFRTLDVFDPDQGE